MCGIAGILGYPASRETRLELVRRMGCAIRHRGPDDEGSYADQDVALGIQRLKVIDLEGGHQPMATEDGNIQIVFNGEIFNFADLRDRLRHEGEAFRTASDTEVILRLYRRHGLDGLEALNGMFAVALWDKASRQLHLIRDRMGVKPLYYYWDGRVFAFASEIKSLFELPALELTIEPRAIWDYLTFRYVPGAGTVWKQVRKLPPAHRLTISAADPAPRVARWWDIPPPASPGRVDEAEVTAEFGRLFTDAVKRRMVADVPVGIMLSGGLDSSAVASVAVESHGTHLKTFSVSFEGSPATDERAYARSVARHIGSDHSEVEIGEREFLDFLPDFVLYTDEPMADLASVPLYYVCRLARQSVTVALSGEGADEILAGYDFDRWWASRLPPGPRPATEAGDLRLDAVPPHMTNYMDSTTKRALFRDAAGFPDSLDVVRGHLAHAGARHPLDQILHVYCQDWLVEDLLMKADRMSMANSLELRTPFLDYRLVEWAARAPLWAKVGPDASGNWRTKQVLRRFAAGRLPNQIIERPKQGFPVPVYDWLSGALRDRARELVLGPGARLAEWFTTAGLLSLVELGTAESAPTHDRHRLWNLMILEYWLRAWTRA
jgi:asparagine synthase (glutamine-hydrolysing)